MPRLSFISFISGTLSAFCFISHFIYGVDHIRFLVSGPNLFCVHSNWKYNYYIFNSSITAPSNYSAFLESLLSVHPGIHRNELIACPCYSIDSSHLKAVRFCFILCPYGTLKYFLFFLQVSKVTNLLELTVSVSMNSAWFAEYFRQFLFFGFPAFQHLQCAYFLTTVYSASTQL